MSLLLEEVRRALWAREGGPERPPPAALGLTDGEVAFGAPLECQTGPRRSAADRAAAARAQQIWEEKARAEAAQWAARLAEDGEAGDGEAAPGRPDFS